MTHIPFNTLESVSQLPDVGIPEAQAKVLVEEKKDVRLDSFAKRMDDQSQGFEVRIMQLLVELEFRLTVIIGVGFVTFGTVMLASFKVMLKP